MALGTSSPLFATLASWQKLDLREAIARMANQPGEGDAATVVVPQNLVRTSARRLPRKFPTPPTPYRWT
jgi:hypothetical protein